MSAITILLVAIVALLAGMEGILDEFQFHQPLVACTLIGLVTGHLQEGILLGGSLQMMALGWANVGAAVAPDAALASVASSIIMVLALNGGATDSAKAVTAAIAVAVPLSVAGLFLTMICRTLATAMVHGMDACAEKATSPASSVGSTPASSCRVFVSPSRQYFCASSRPRPLPTRLTLCPIGCPAAWLSAAAWSLPSVTPWSST